MIIKDLLNYFNHASKTIKNIHEFKARLHYEDELRNYTIIGNKLDRKQHLAVVLPIGEDESGNTVILTTNLTSKKEIKFNEEVKVTLEREYELKHNGKLISKSYESPVIKETLTERDKKLIKITGYDKDDIRTIVNNSCYPDITFNEISFPNNKETVLVEKLDKNIQLKKIEKGSVLIDVLKKEGGKEILK